jgi:hypothetical protein
MRMHGELLAGCVMALLLLVASGWTEAATARHSGVIMSLDKTAGAIVLGDMGPRLKSGESKLAPRTVRVTPSTEFVRVKRAGGAAPNGWVGDYVETKLAAWDVKPGEWVTIVTEGEPRHLTAVKITVVDTSEP